MKNKKASQLDAVVSLHLDTRSSKKDNKHPVKIRIWDFTTQSARLFTTKVDLTEKEFASAWNTKKKISKNYLDLNEKLYEIENRAKDIVKDLDPFTFDAFKLNFYKAKGDKTDIVYSYTEIIKDFEKLEQLGTASNYELSKKSLLKFMTHKNKKECKSISYYVINKKWLEDYEKYMVSVLSRSETTVSMYLRALRTVFKKAISNKIIHPDYYPFGQTDKLYSIPTANKVKKALKSDEISLLFNAVPLTKEQEKAKDFWFFSYACNGMNIKDIAQLKFKDFEHKKFEYHRAKTINTKKKRRKNTVYLNDYINIIIEKYGKENKHPQSYVFSILDEKQDASTQRRKIQAFTRFINQHMKRLCVVYDLPIVSTYWARHSFATNAIKQGKTMEFMQQLLGHENIETTQNYFGGFEDETLIEFSQNIMKF